MFVVSVCYGQNREELKPNVTLFYVRVWEVHYRKELILNVIFFVRVWGGQNREELITNVNVFVVMVWGVQYREELILNVTVFVVRFWGGKKKGTETECYSVLCESLGRSV